MTIVVEASGATIPDVARALELAARRIRLEYRRARRAAERPAPVVVLAERRRARG